MFMFNVELNLQNFIVLSRVVMCFLTAFDLSPIACGYGSMFMCFE